MSVIRRLLPVVLAVALGGCGSDLLRPLGLGGGEAKGPPAWFSKPPQEPGMVYAVGGAGPGERDAALARARNDLSSQLRLSIRSSTTQREEYASTQASGETRAERLAQAARSVVKAKTSAEDLPGVTMVEQADRNDGTYVLLRLDRNTWAEDLRSRIAALDARLPGEAAAVTGMPVDTPAARLRSAGQHIRRLLPLLVQRDEYCSRLRIALPGSQMPADSIDRAALDRRLQGLLADLTVTLPADPSVKPLETSLVNALRNVGLQPVPAGRPGVMTMPLTLTVRVQHIDDQVRADGMLSGMLALSNEAGGTQLGGIELSERAGGNDEAVARERLAGKLAKRLAEDLDQRLTRMLAGD